MRPAATSEAGNANTARRALGNAPRTGLKKPPAGLPLKVMPAPLKSAMYSPTGFPSVIMRFWRARLFTAMPIFGSLLRLSSPIWRT